MSVSFGTVNSRMGGSGEVRRSSDVPGTGHASLRMLWTLRGLCVAGLGISVYLAWTALSMTPVYGCGGGDVIDCGHVLKSKWSKVFGIPVSVPAGGLYASMLVIRRPECSSSNEADGLECVDRRSLYGRFGSTVVYQPPDFCVEQDLPVLCSGAYLRFSDGGVNAS